MRTPLRSAGIVGLTRRMGVAFVPQPPKEATVPKIFFRDHQVLVDYYTSVYL
jgi:hypothetical protein